MKEFKVEWRIYDKETTTYGEQKADEIVEAETEEEAIELVKQYIFDNADHEEYTDIKIKEDSVDFSIFEYCNFVAKEV